MKITFPCLNTRMVPAGQVIANDYNPNKVATPEMEYLKYSISEFGFSVPVVVYHDTQTDLYIVIDGFHRRKVLADFRCTEIPVVVLDIPVEKRMAATIAFNRARGKHQVNLMGELVAKLVAKGLNDEQIAVCLGMSGEEVLRLRQQVKAAVMLANGQYGRSWEMTDEKPGSENEEGDDA